MSSTEAAAWRICWRLSHLEGNDTRSRLLASLNIDVEVFETTLDYLEKLNVVRTTENEVHLENSEYGGPILKTSRRVL